MAPPRRRRSPFDLFGDDMFEDFERMQEEMERMLHEAAKRGPMQPSQPGQPLVYGFNIRVGPEGKPHIEQFGNVNVQQRKISNEREPLIDVIEEEKAVRVIIELPGASKDSIHVETKDSTLTVNAQSHDQKFRKTVDLPAEVLKDGSKASFKNGILEVILPKRTPSKPKASQIRID